MPLIAIKKHTLRAFFCSFVCFLFCFFVCFLIQLQHLSVLTALTLFLLDEGRKCFI